MPTADRIPGTASIRSVVVFCGSRMGVDPAAHAAAAAMGSGLAAAGIRLVYGGGRNGLMGVVADAALAGGANVTGIIPDFLRGQEAAHHGVSDLVVTTTMHDRKTRMYTLADAFVTLPGGLGTLDETVEVITWRQLRLHDKPILVVDVNGWATRVGGTAGRLHHARVRRPQHTRPVSGGARRRDRAAGAAGSAGDRRWRTGAALTLKAAGSLAASRGGRYTARSACKGGSDGT